jgi:dipeptidyl aminopeptidase/acylaminoacyl peptidase
VAATIEQLLEADPVIHAIIDPAYRYVLLVHERRLLPLERLARPAIELAGQRIDPRALAAHGQRDYHALTLVDLGTNERHTLPLPRDVTIGYPSLAPDGSRFAFTVTRAGGTELWIGDPFAARARPLAEALNALHGQPCEWTSDSRRLLCRVVAASRSQAHAVLGGLDAALERTPPQAPFGQPSMLAPELVGTLLESRLMLIDSLSGQRHLIGPRAAYESARLSPAGAFMLVTRLVPPYPSVSGVDRARRVVELWDRTGKELLTLPAKARAPEWVYGQPATLTWIENDSGIDRIMLLAPPFDAPRASFALTHRFAGLRWLGDGATALVGDYDPSTRVTELKVVNLGRLEGQQGEVPVALRYASASPLFPLMRSDAQGAPVALHAGQFYVRGTEEAAGRALRRFVDRVALDGSGRRRAWDEGSSSGPVEIMGLLAEDGRRLLVREQTGEASTTLWIEGVDGQRIAALTDDSPGVTGLTRDDAIDLEYARGDGLPLRATLHLPPEYDGAGALPMVVWAYPRNVGAEAAVSIEGSDPRSMTFEHALRALYLLHGYAVLDDVAMPIVGDTAAANDTFVEQIVANARAAITAAAATGAVDVSRIGVAGHSYGAFMVANLLAHSNLFAVGAALSGAYNRTLTPFGFQTERRTLWEAPDTYLAMSPLLYSHQIHVPLLLVHGLNDDNAGTSPLQSTQFYEAIRGNDGEAKLVLLPWEGHTYRARESVQRTATEMLAWFDRFLKPDGESQK